MGADLESRSRKTSALMRLTLMAGAEAGGAPAASVELLADCGERLGRAYQMLDDLLDRSDASGKTAAQDDRHNRAAWHVSREAILAEVAECAGRLTDRFGDAAEPLVSAIGCVFARLEEARLVAA